MLIVACAGVVAIWHTSLRECSLPVKGGFSSRRHPGARTWPQWLRCWTFGLGSFSCLSFGGNRQVWRTA